MDKNNLILKAENISKHFGENCILNKVSLVKRTTNRREYQVINTPTGEMATFTIQVATP